MNGLKGTNNFDILYIGNAKALIFAGVSTKLGK